MWNIWHLLGITILLHNVHGFTRVDPLVQTKVGLIRGLREPKSDFSMFLGIPFAKVDAQNPFGPAIPYGNFEGEFEAYDDSAICPQQEEFNNTITGTLDCLHLNVYVPTSASSKNRLPVLVWIYGGGFEMGFAGRYLYGPRYLVKHDIILVTLNYRIGPYGFMCLDNPNVPGNQGLKDQLAALRWINENIEAFGGDVNKITLFGESAGSASVDLHLYSTQEKLFHKVILQSGQALGPWAVEEPDLKAPLKLAEHLGYSTDDTTAALSFLATVSPTLVIAATKSLNLEFKPCVEKTFADVEKFIGENPINANVPKSKNIPILLGFIEQEWLAKYANKEAAFFQNLDPFNDYMSSLFNFEDTYQKSMEGLVRHFYIGDEAVSEKIKFDLVNLDSDFYFVYPAQRSIEKYLENGATKIYQYMFSYNGGRNFVKVQNNITIGGAAHADEIGYLFDISFWSAEPTPEDQLIIDRITTLWANFVKYGDPTPETTEILPIKWPTVTADTYSYLNIDTKLEVLSRPYHERMAFWELFYKVNEKYQKGYVENDK